MAYSTQNMYQMFDIIPNFIRKMFPLSLKTYPSCTNTMAWDIRDEIRSAYILKMVHQRDNHKAVIDDSNAYARDNVFPKEVGVCGSQPISNDFHVVNDSQLGSSISDQCEHLLCNNSISSVKATTNSVITDFSPKKMIRPSQPKTIFHSSSDKCHDYSSTCDTSRSPDQTIQLIVESSSKFDSKNNLFSENPQNSIEHKSTVEREYQLLAQKFHQYTINCKMTIKTLEEKLQKLIDDKHALLHGMVSLRKGQKDVIKKYRKIFNDAMSEHCNEINALLASYKVIRDNYLALLQQDTTLTDTNQNDEVLSVSYTSYNCC